MSKIHNQILPDGNQLGVYEIKETSKIDRFIITYRAWNHHLKEQVEIQEYFPHDFAIRSTNGLGVEPKAPSDKENFDYGLKAFLAQAEILTQIDHPNIVKAENILQFNGTAYLIMDYAEGVPLSKLIRSPASFAETELQFILASILNALQTVHENKIVHGGLQPASIILGKNGEPLLTDFAAARLAMAAHSGKLSGDIALGYAPPELYENANETGPETDFYALGATMYFCITHNPPNAAQSRALALSKGEPDPMASLSETSGTPYSAELLQAIDWMLQPEYNDRPHSSIEVLALLKSASKSDQAEPKTAKHEAIAVAKRGAMVKNSVWIGAMVGMAGLVVVGLWFGRKPTEIMDSKSSTVATQSSLQSNSDNNLVTSEIKKTPSVALSATQSTQESGESTKKEINESEKKLNPTDEEIQLRTSANDNQPQTALIAESSPFPASRPVSKPDLKDKTAIEQESGRRDSLAVIDNSLQLSKKQNLSEHSADAQLIKEYLVAAKKAMKAVHLTTPLSDNAKKYYQMVLAIDPGNKEALAGLQKIVDRYVWFIEDSKAEGKLSTAKRALQKAESVLPDDPKLQHIRAELAAVKK